MSSRGREGGERRWNGAGWDGAAAAAAAAWERPAWERPLRVVYPASTAKECLFRRLPGRLEGPCSPTPRGAAGGSQEGLVKASECHLKREALVGLEGLTERRWGGWIWPGTGSRGAPAHHVSEALFSRRPAPQGCAWRGGEA